jgi:hypothetical protein
VPSPDVTPVVDAPVNTGPTPEEIAAQEEEDREKRAAAALEQQNDGIRDQLTSDIKQVGNKAVRDEVESRDELIAANATDAPSFDANLQNIDSDRPNGNLVDGAFNVAIDQILPKVLGVPPSCIKDIAGAKNDGELGWAIASCLASELLRLPPWVAPALTETETAPRRDDEKIPRNLKNY